MKRGEFTAIVFLLLSTLLIAPQVVSAQVPGQSNLQGRLTDDMGETVADGTYDMTFALYSAASEGSALWSELQSVEVTGGVYNVILGQPGNELPADLFSADLYLGLTVGGDDEMTPRQMLTSVAYAFKAENADTLGGLAAADFLTGSQPAVIDTSDEGYALSVSNSGTGGAADLDGFVNVDHGNLLVQGQGSFDGSGEQGVVYLGDTGNYIKAVYDSGVHIGAFAAADALAVKAVTGNVGIGTTDPTARLDVAGDLKASGSLTVAGTVESTTGGFRFPDGSSQTSAGASQAYVSALEARITALETLLADVTRSGSDITFSGVNVHVVNGTGTTDGTPNGVGNLIVGYNEVRGSGDDRSGSHNVVVGSRHNYSSYGGLVGGYYNTVSGSYTSVSGGSSNTASGQNASVAGGASNTASGNNASINGGSYNKASGRASFVGGGGSGNSSDGNEAFGDYTAILGGHSNLTGDHERNDHSIGRNATISGGGFNRASGDAAFVGGGGGDLVYSGNNAFGHYATVLGGASNIAGSWTLTDRTLGLGSSICGGEDNNTSGDYAVVSGGWDNQAGGWRSSVSGGAFNFAEGLGTSISGGEFNSADGNFASVSGGRHNGAGGTWASISGGGFNSTHASGASVSGGADNKASSVFASVSGGQNNTASGEYASVSGGRFNTASGDFSFVGGGGHSNADFGNEAFSNYSAVLGGSYNIAGDNSDLEDHSVGELATITGGDTNRARGGWSSISGGLANETSSNHTTVSGGAYNEATNSYATVSGGHNNTASGASSSVSGGQSNTAINAFDSVVGNYGAVYVDSTPVH